MTREQAEIVLHSIKFILDNAQYSDDVEEALNIAIEELKNSERTEKSSQNVSNDDLISRKAAIDAICTEGTRLERNGTVAMAEIKQWCVDILDALPSAQPEQKKGKWEKIEVIPEAYDIAGVKTWASKMRCNQCGFTTFAIEGRFAQHDFCPNCGSYNGGEQE